MIGQIPKLPTNEVSGESFENPAVPWRDLMET
jgi:hypothetical protein